MRHAHAARSPPVPGRSSSEAAQELQGFSLAYSATSLMAALLTIACITFYVLQRHVLASPPQGAWTIMDDLKKNDWGSMADMLNPYTPSGTVRSILPRLQESIENQFKVAQKCQARWNRTTDDIHNRLAAVYLHARATYDVYSTGGLACSIECMLAHVAPSTPLDIYVFVNEKHIKTVEDLLKDQMSAEKVDSVCLVGIPSHQWRHHRMHGAPYRLPGSENRFMDYLLMGQWRLLVPYNIMHSLGYSYFLQVDEDLFVLEPFQVNLVSEMRSRDVLITTHALMPERWDIVHGLPELARFFLLSNALKPGGSLWAHVSPPNMTGLFSPTENWWEKESQKLGYDTFMLYGNFLIMSTSLWNRDAVQDWITLAMSSGGMERHRWQEQSIFAWVWLLFTEEHQLWQLNSTFKWQHSKQRSAEIMCGFLFNHTIRGFPSHLLSPAPHHHEESKPSSKEPERMLLLTERDRQQDARRIP